MFSCMFCDNDAEATGEKRTSTQLSNAGGSKPFCWGYEECNGPHMWSKHFPAARGIQQSPIDIDVQRVERTNTDMSVKVFYKETNATCVNNGHTVVWTPEDGGYVVIKNKQYKLVQFHYHCPSEHTFAGSSFPIEVHFVNQHKETGELAVLGHIFQFGNLKNPFIANITETKPLSPTDGEVQIANIDFSNLKNLKAQYIHYKGSLTTPPCSEGVLWYVCTTVSNISERQHSWFKEACDFKSNRPVQELNGREMSLTFAI